MDGQGVDGYDCLVIPQASGDSTIANSQMLDVSEFCGSMITFMSHADFIPTPPKTVCCE